MPNCFVCRLFEAKALSIKLCCSLAIYSLFCWRIILSCSRYPYFFRLEFPFSIISLIFCPQEKLLHGLVVSTHFLILVMLKTTSQLLHPCLNINPQLGLPSISIFICLCSCFLVRSLLNEIISIFSTLQLV